VATIAAVLMVALALGVAASPAAAQVTGPVFIDGQAQPVFSPDPTTWIREELWVESQIGRVFPSSPVIRWGCSTVERSTVRVLTLCRRTVCREVGRIGHKTGHSAQIAPKHPETAGIPLSVESERRGAGSPVTPSVKRAGRSANRPARQAGGHWFEPSTAHLEEPLHLLYRMN
jgi:hypothetical protein